MKSLKESILGSTNTGKQKILKDKIEEWCKKYKPFNGFYKINSNNEIEATNGNEIMGNQLLLEYIDYDELPSYIQFADNEFLTIYIGGEYNKRTITRNIKSFRGLPKICKNLYFWNCYIKKLPKLEIKLNYCLFKAEIREIEEMHLDFYSYKYAQYDCELAIKEDIGKSFKNIYVKNVKTINIVNDFYFGDEFSKAMARKAPMNKYRYKYEFPVTDAGLDVINTFFGKTVDISNLEEIQYTQNSKLVKHKGLWYRCKNW
jgi:hypothetical protein